MTCTTFTLLYTPESGTYNRDAFVGRQNRLWGCKDIHSYPKTCFSFIQQSGKGGEEFQHSHSKHAFESALKVIGAKGQEAVNKGARVGNGGHRVGQSGGRKGHRPKGDRGRASGTHDLVFGTHLLIACSD